MAKRMARQGDVLVIETDEREEGDRRRQEQLPMAAEARVESVGRVRGDAEEEDRRPDGRPLRGSRGAWLGSRAAARDHGNGRADFENFFVVVIY